MAETTGDIVPNSIDRQAHEFLLASCRDGGLDLFEMATSSDVDALAACKTAADLLVSRRLAQFSDEGRTRLGPTNAGRYWAANGGYMGFLKEPQSTVSGGGGRQRNPELEALRFTYMKLRLATFWWSFGLSLAGFVISLVSIGIALMYGDLLLR